MSVVVLDTNIVSYLMKGHSLVAAYRSHLEGNTLAISFMTIAELYEGAYRSNWSRRRRDVLKQLLKNYLVIPYSPRVCEIWGRIRADRKTQPIAVDDAWIAASAVAYDCALVTHNPADFEGIADLKILTKQI